MATDSPLRSRARSALISARRERDRATVSTLRTVLSALENAEAVPMTHAPAAGALEQSATGPGSADAPRRVLTEAEETEVLEAEIASLDEAARTYDQVAPDRAAAARTAMDVLSTLR